MHFQNEYSKTANQIYSLEISGENLKTDLEQMLKPFKNFRTDQENPVRYKFSNNRIGVDPKIKKILNEWAEELQVNELPLDDKSIVMDLALAFTLFSNHMDQGPEEDRNIEVIKKWLKSAYKLAHVFIPNLEKIINTFQDEQLKIYQVEELSLLAMILHYYGKSRRLTATKSEKIDFMNECQPFVMAAYNIAIYLERLNAHKEDIHEFKDRVPTYTLPIIYNFIDVKQYDDAINLLHTLISHLKENNNYFHLIQAYVQLSKVILDKDKNLADKSLAYAIEAEKIITELENNKVEDFTKNPLKWNVQVRLMKAYFAKGEIEKAKEIAELIITTESNNKKYIQENKKDLVNWGLKSDPHIVEAEKILQEINSQNSIRFKNL